MQNVERIRESRELLSAASLLRELGIDPNSPVRRAPLLLGTGESAVELRDQGPLHEGNIVFSPGFSFQDLLNLLNARVFFWPGKADGRPIDYRVRHFNRNAPNGPALLRVPFRDLLTANPRVPPQLCLFNSGSPRCSAGKKNPRSPDTFVDANRFFHPPSRVVEVTFETRVALPGSTEISSSPNGPWRTLGDTAVTSPESPAYS